MSVAAAQVVAPETGQAPWQLNVSQADSWLQIANDNLRGLVLTIDTEVA